VNLTGNCPHCGTKVLTDVSIAGPEAQGASEKLSRREFISRLEALNRRETRRQVVLVSIGFSIIFGGIPLLSFLDYLRERGALDWAGALNMDLVAKILLVLLFFLLVGAVAVFIYSASGKQKRIGIPCPHCQKPLSGAAAHIAIATHSCPWCGEKLFD
jgi:hypothetical protein